MRYTYDNNGKCTGITNDNPPPYRSTDIQPPQPDPNHYVAFSNGGWVQIPIQAIAATTPEQIILQLTSALELHYNATAQQKRYDNRFTCALRAGYAGPFQAEGQAFALWMDTCNTYAYQVMQDVEDGKRGIPTGEELIAEMPEMVWP